MRKLLSIMVSGMLFGILTSSFSVNASETQEISLEVVPSVMEVSEEVNETVDILFEITIKGVSAENPIGALQFTLEPSDGLTLSDVDTTSVNGNGYWLNPGVCEIFSFASYEPSTNILAYAATTDGLASEEVIMCELANYNLLHFNLFSKLIYPINKKKVMITCKNICKIS